MFGAFPDCASLHPGYDYWIASRSLSSGAHSRDQLARNDGFALTDRAKLSNRFNKSARRANHF